VIIDKAIFLRNARIIRKVLPRDAEYKVRDFLLSISRVTYESSSNKVIHACTWKSASQWVRMILSDPIIYKNSGLRPLVPSSSDQMRKVLESDQGGSGTFKNKRILTPAYVTRDRAELALIHEHDRAFFVSRDPRDLLISRYFSRASAHPANEKIVAWRDKLGKLDIESGLIAVMDDFDDIAVILRSWASPRAESDNYFNTSYEKLTGEDNIASWSELMKFLDIGLSSDRLEALLNQYSFSAMSGGRGAGEEKKDHKYRKGQPGDWKNHFTPEVERQFIFRYGDIIRQFGSDSI